MPYRSTCVLKGGSPKFSLCYGHSQNGLYIEWVGQNGTVALPPLRAQCGRHLSYGFSWQWRRFSERIVPLAESMSVRTLLWVVFPWIAFMLVLNLLLIAPALNYFWADHEPGQPRAAYSIAAQSDSA